MLFEKLIYLAGLMIFVFVPSMRDKERRETFINISKWRNLISILLTMLAIAIGVEFIFYILKGPHISLENFNILSFLFILSINTCIVVHFRPKKWEWKECFKFRNIYNILTLISVVQWSFICCLLGKQS